MAYPGTFVTGQVLTAAEMNAINEGASARPLLTGGAYIDGTNGLVLSGLSGNFAETPDSAALSVTGDIDIKVKLTGGGWAVNPPVAQALVNKYTTNIQRSYGFVLSTSSELQFFHSADGTTEVVATSTIGTSVFQNAATYWARATIDVDDGAGNYVVKFYISPDGTTWSQLGSTITTAGTTSIYDGTSPVRFGSALGITASPPSGTIHRVIIQDAYDTADNTTSVVFDADFAAEAADTLAFTEDSGNAATVSVTTTRYYYGLPDLKPISTATGALTANRDYYTPFLVTEAVSIDMFAFGVTVGPSGTNTTYMAIYNATDDQQPTGAPLATTSLTVATSATGTFYSQITPVTLKPGAYILAWNSSHQMTFRQVVSAINSGMRQAFDQFGVAALLLATRTAATFTSNPLEWTSVVHSDRPSCPVLLRWKAA